MRVIRHFAKQVDRSKCDKGLLALFTLTHGIEWAFDASTIGGKGAHIITKLPDVFKAGTCFGNVQLKLVT